MTVLLDAVNKSTTRASSPFSKSEMEKYLEKMQEEGLVYLEGDVVVLI